MKRKTTLTLFLLVFLPFILVKANTLCNSSTSTLFAPPANDECASAIDLVVNSNYLCANYTSGTLLDATASSQSVSGCGTITQSMANDDVWFKFVATSTAHRVQLYDIAGNQTNLYHIVYDAGSSGDCGALTAIFCSDPNTSDPDNLIIGNTYYVRVFTNATTGGANTTFKICVGTEPSVPSNDACVDAQSIDTFPFSQVFDASGATNNSGFITASGCIGMNDGVWFTITGNGDKVNIVLTPNAWNGAIAVYEGSCSSLSCVDSKNAGSTGIVESLSFNSTSGTTYYINIGYPSSITDLSEGIFTLNVTLTALSVDEIIAKGFSYYPNPVRNDVLNLTAKEPISQISIYNMLGREIKRVNDIGTSFPLDLNDVPAGAYYIRATIGDKSGTFKILKE